MKNEVAIAFNKFGKYVVQQSRTNLTKHSPHPLKDKGDLYSSLKYEVKENKNSVQFSLFMEDYGIFVDKGVKGVGGTKADGTKWKQKKVTTKDFKYRDKMPPPKIFDGWAVRKGIAPRTNKGQFAARKGLQFAIAKSIFHKGLETTKFFTKPFERAFDRLPDEIIEAYSFEVDKFMQATLDNAK